jgi:hypothetical protein
MTAGQSSATMRGELPFCLGIQVPENSLVQAPVPVPCWHPVRRSTWISDGSRITMLLGTRHGGGCASGSYTASACLLSRLRPLLTCSGQLRLGAAEASPRPRTDPWGVIPLRRVRMAPGAPLAGSVPSPRLRVPAHGVAGLDLSLSRASMLSLQGTCPVDAEEEKDAVAAPSTPRRTPRSTPPSFALFFQSPLGVLNATLPEPSRRCMHAGSMESRVFSKQGRR